MENTEPPLACPDDHAVVEYERGEITSDQKIWVTHRLQCKGCTACVRHHEIVDITQVNPG